MRVRHLSLTNFRLYARLEAALPPGPLILLGANAQGKTSLLEALYYLATGESPHAAAGGRVITFLAVGSGPRRFARLVAEVEIRREVRRLEIRLIQDTNGN